MEAYGKFAQVYDMFMDNIDYEKWAEYIEEHLKARGIEDGLVLELGCGTGTMTGLLAQKGYDMIGVDNSEEMLAEAMKKKWRPDRISCIFCRICRNLSCMERCGQW